MRKRFGPKDEQERLVFAVEGLRADVQLTIQEVMHSKGITRSHLAKLLGCSPANVTHLLAEDGNPTIETIARVFHVLGDTCAFESRFLKEQAAASSGRERQTGHPEVTYLEKARHQNGYRQRNQPQPTMQMVIQVAKGAMRRHAWGPAHNQNFTLNVPRAA
jgi:transcriptional regulator with XRE-family HTH domain